MHVESQGFGKFSSICVLLKLMSKRGYVKILNSLQNCIGIYCLTKISIRAKRSISRVFSLFIVPSPFFVHCPYKGRIDRAESVLTGLKPY